MITEEIRQELLLLRDEKYRAFQLKLIPSVDPGRVIGVRTPKLRQLAKRFGAREDIGTFLNALPHAYFDEDQLHAFVISAIKDFDRCLCAVSEFLPHVDNWATCDQMSPPAFKKHKSELMANIETWLHPAQTYTVRFGIKMLMDHFLDGDFEQSFPEAVARVNCGEYYVSMMVAWYFATALAKQYSAVLPYIEQRRLDARTHARTIQKALESYRLNAEQKEYLRSLR